MQTAIPRNDKHTTTTVCLRGSAHRGIIKLKEIHHLDLPDLPLRRHASLIVCAVNPVYAGTIINVSD